MIGPSPSIVSTPHRFHATLPAPSAYELWKRQVEAEARRCLKGEIRGVGARARRAQRG